MRRLGHQPQAGGEGRMIGAPSASFAGALKELLGEGRQSLGASAAAAWADGSSRWGRPDEAALMCASPLGALTGRLSAARVRRELAPEQERARWGALEGAERIAQIEADALAREVASLSTRAVQSALIGCAASPAQARKAWSAYWTAYIDASLEGAALRQEPLSCARALASALGSEAMARGLGGLVEYGWEGVERPEGDLHGFYWACLELCAELGADTAIDSKRWERAVVVDRWERTLGAAVGLKSKETAEKRLERLKALVERFQISRGVGPALGNAAPRRV